MKRYYKAVVETGSCSMPGRDRIDPATGERSAYWEEQTTCGHKHRTYDTAWRCLQAQRKTDKYGCCSALWYNGRIHDQDGCRTLAPEFADLLKVSKIDQTGG